MTYGFRQADRPLGRRESAVVNFHRTEFLASGTGLILVEQLGLLDGEFFHDMSSDGLPHLTGGGFDAGKGGLFSGQVVGLQIDSDFFGHGFECLLIFG